ncbi:ribosomal RNA small subunit methyltransferase E [Thiomicrorhabdus immobilis]|uniref:Ribosomal RNA small subunit methyltransferase E n=1 Tax=Thiomicrorhabdus immobilis TaxID=2791037 RepID=A0ABN6CZQ0_9GAMM|nr:16S rRNA (uracil(1498)-N(3))-methyltransferase [Thiomicrorhabdus immobilis]BCN94104.1 ribosomal RNA small subunit methyltransferase E [Thiomicrorhabdus immobilis]
MRISRLFLEGNYQAKQTIALPKEQAHYVLTVLRLKNNYTIEAFNGHGLLARGKLIVTSRRTADFEIESVEQTHSESPLNTILVQGISKGDRMDYSIQKAVELGVTAIQPVFTERCDVKLQDEKREKRQQQWQAIVINACEQSGRTVVPKVLPILTYQAWLESLQNAESKPFGLVLDPYAKDSLATVNQPLQEVPINLLIGPEGGLTEAEVDAAKTAGLTPVQLGPRVLRTETAGPAILAILQTLWGDFGV